MKKKGNSKKATKVKAAAPGANFSAQRAVELYKAGSGKNVSEIAQAFGYPKGFGNNRVRNALMKAGVYKGTSSAPVKTTARKRVANPAPAKRSLSLGVPNDPETALQICLKTIDVNTSKLKLDEQARSRFARTLMGSIATTFGIQDFQVRRPVLVLDETKAMPHVMRVASA